MADGNGNDLIVLDDYHADDSLYEEQATGRRRCNSYSSGSINGDREQEVHQRDNQRALARQAIADQIRQRLQRDVEGPRFDRTSTPMREQPFRRNFLASNGVLVDDRDNVDSEPRRNADERREVPGAQQHELGREPRRLFQQVQQPLLHREEARETVWARQLTEAMKIENPPALSGNEDLETRNKWAVSMNMKFLLWPFQFTSMDVVFQHVLKGKAYQAYSGMPRHPIETDREHARRIIDTFAAMPQLSTSEMVKNLKDLQRRKIRKGESYDDFFEFLKKEIARFDWDQRTQQTWLLSIFLENIPVQHRTILKAQDRLTPDRALEMAKRMIEEQESETTESSYGQLAATKVGPSMEDVQRLIVDTMIPQQEQIQKLSSDVTKLATEKDQMVQKVNEQKADTKKQGKQKQANMISSTACQICGKNGHTADICFSRHEGVPNVPRRNQGTQRGREGNAPPNTNNTPVKCQLCDGEGHAAKSCPSKQSSAPVCYYCGQEGHFRRDCPQLRNTNRYQFPRYGNRGGRGGYFRFPYGNSYFGPPPAFPYQSFQTNYPPLFPQQQGYLPQLQNYSQAPPQGFPANQQRSEQRNQLAIDYHQNPEN